MQQYDGQGYPGSAAADPSYGVHGAASYDMGGESAPLLANRSSLMYSSKIVYIVAAVSTLVPWLFFVVTLFCILEFFHRLFYAVNLGVIFGAAACLIGSLFSRNNRKSTAYVFQLSLMAILWGYGLGFFMYTFELYDVLTYYDRQPYTNIYPDEPAAAYRDASVIVFAEGAAPTVTQPIAFQGAMHAFCVVPITMANAAVSSTDNDIQYWAVGKDCCTPSRFECGDVADPDAKAGLVEHLPQYVKQYKLAVRMAVSKFAMKSAEEPMFVEWYRDYEYVLKERKDKVWTAFFVLSFLYFLVSLLGGIYAIRIGRKWMPHDPSSKILNKLMR